MIISLTREFRFEAAHRLTNHPGICRNLHGHSFLATVEISGRVVPETGMVLDYADLKRVAGVFDEWDHAALLWRGDRQLIHTLTEMKCRVYTFSSEPTSEVLAMTASDIIAKRLPESVVLRSVTVRETVNCAARARSELRSSWL